MSALTPWDPFRELDELQNRLATMFGRIPQRQGRPYRQRSQDHGGLGSNGGHQRG